MAIFGVLTNAYAAVNSVDLSDHCSKITTTDSRAQVNVTAMGATTDQLAKGLGTSSIVMDFFGDFSAGKVFATLQPLISSTSTVPVEARPVNAARSATNPAFLLANASMFDFPGLDAQIGAALTGSYTFVNGVGGAGMTYPTS